MKLSKPPAAGSAEAGAGGDSVGFFSTGAVVWQRICVTM